MKKTSEGKGITKKQFTKLFGENPVDVLGQDWKNDLKTMSILKQVEIPIKENYEITR